MTQPGGIVLTLTDIVVPAGALQYNNIHILPSSSSIVYSGLTKLTNMSEIIILIIIVTILYFSLTLKDNIQFCGK